MDISLLLKIVGLGLLVAIACQILQRSGRDEMATLVSISGMVLIFVLLLSGLTSLISTVKTLFGL